MNKNHYVAIMAGGIGSRFWPQSRVNRPKQFLDILGTGETLLQSTYKRFAEIVPKENIYIVTGQRYTNLVKTQLPEIEQTNIIAEPGRKNTAPCVAYVAYKLAAKNSNASFVVAPSDHLITNDTAFVDNIKQALAFADNNNELLTLGIKPTSAHTGYGYIHFDNKDNQNGVYGVQAFTEKPDLDTAKKMVADGSYLWNAGIFIWSVKSIVHAFEKYQPAIAQLFEKGNAQYNTPNETNYIEQMYPKCPSISIDYAIMEYAKNVRVIPATFGWNDLGSWSSLWEQLPKDAQNNAVLGDKVKLYEADNCVVSTNGDKLMVLQGLSDYCIVNTDDVLIICKKSDEQKIKQMNADVVAKLGEDYA